MPDSRAFTNTRLNNLWLSLSNGEENIEVDAFIELVAKLGYDIMEPQAVVLMFILDVSPESSAAPKIPKANFLKNMSMRGIDSLSKLKKAIKHGPGAALFSDFYNYVFQMNRETPQHKYIGKFYVAVANFQHQCYSQLMRLYLQTWTRPCSASL
jgi:hypothetical protein